MNTYSKGHAMNKILKDIINRFHVIQGRKVNYIPGWDCHGLPIETKTLIELRKEASALPPAAIRAGALHVAEREIIKQKEQFCELGIMADWTTEGTYRTLDTSYEIRQLRVFQQMIEKGAVAISTLPLYSTYIDAGLIYRNYRPVHYSPSSLSALAEAELNYQDDHVSRSVYVFFQLEAPLETTNTVLADRFRLQSGGVKLMVWTTTPWTLTANMGIAVNPEMEYSFLEMASGETVVVAKERISALSSILGSSNEIFTITGKDLIDFTYRPLFPSTPRSIAPFKIIPATHVTPESGTGLVHCAPAHGADDYVSFRALGLLREQDSASLICHVDSKGLDVLTSGTHMVIEQLKKMGDVLVWEENITHRYPYDWRTDKPIIVTATSQWFVSLDSIKEKALDALKDITFYPPESRNRLESFVRSRSEWCISRQRVWGVPIPSLHHISSGKAVLDARSLAHIIALLEKNGPNYWWTASVSELVPHYLLTEFGTPEDVETIEKEWVKGTDTMDVWFDSGCSWALLRDQGIQSESKGVNAYADICLEGSDQHRGWFQSMLLTAVATAPEADTASESAQAQVLPYKTLITHGMVLDQEGKKMSKSLGNVLDLMLIIKGGKDLKKDPAYGADVLRFWVASVDFSRDVALGPAVLGRMSDSMKKIRNTMRFLLGNIGDEKSRESLVRVDVKDMSIADRYVMRELLYLEESVLGHYAQYNFSQITKAISRFANVTLSALYFDITKDILYANQKTSLERRAVITVLEQVLWRLVFMLAPITPHLAEEVYFYVSGASGPKQDGLSVFTKRWVPLSDEIKNTLNDVEVQQDMDVLLKVRSSVLGLLEEAREQKHLKNSLEAEVDIIVPNNWAEQGSEIATVLHRHKKFLKTLFIVSDVSIIDESFLGTGDEEWMYNSPLNFPYVADALRIRIRPSSREKCPRCWAYSRSEEDSLCDRCADVERVNYS
ncbi:hypothetical protein EW145_g2354 [Phellinidium pouzarii]|uniref:isoleucine--tRNA ligase n=1 Tax=Phellinidium pouzarii TaxID=167371 RepID=A0A4S4LBM0_9AGAM|nr:hypothetical protein EW145_g2354 [Phellinidium pouzarii]